MSEILERLRRLHGLREQKRAEPESHSTGAIDDEPAGEARPSPALLAPTGPQRLTDAVPGTIIETEAGACYLSAHAYPLEILRGDQPLGTLLHQSPALLDELYTTGVQAAEAQGARFDYTQAAFIDTETSGLGSGSCCFMVGIGTFERLTDLPALHPGIDNAGPDNHKGFLADDLHAYALHEDSIRAPKVETPSIPPHEATHFVVRQYFMRHPGEETALLASLSAQLAAYNMTVTFNGRAFDLPLLRSRFRLHRHFLPATTPPPDLLDERRVHIDLLPPARRLWRRRLQSCRLINLEQKILQLYRSEDDVPGHLIPQYYVDFTRSGDARAMRQVFYHNREDIVSMVGLAVHMTNTLRTGAGESTHTGIQTHTDDKVAPTLHGHEWLALGQHYVKQGRREEAIVALQQATETLVNPQDRALALAELATLYKKAGQWEQACATWQLWISSIPGHDPTPYIELAKYCEWQSRDLSQAEMWTGWALHNLRQADTRSHYRVHLDELEHRLQRLQRKRNHGSSTGPSPTVGVNDP